MVRNANMLVAVNAWNPDDVFGTLPGEAPPVPNGIDFYLSESYQIKEGGHLAGQEIADWKTKANKLEVYRPTLNFKVMSITTNDLANQYDEDKFHYAWYSALLYGHEATGWGEYRFTADASNNGVAPFAVIRQFFPGRAFISLVRTNNTGHSRDTSRIRNPQRFVIWWAKGTVWIDTATHQYGFRNFWNLIDLLRELMLRIKRVFEQFVPPWRRNGL